MQRSPHLALLATLALVIASCADAGTAQPRQDPEAMAQQPSTEAALTAARTDAIGLASDISRLWVHYVGSVVSNGAPDEDLAIELSSLYNMTTANLNADDLGECTVETVQALRSDVGMGIWEHSSWRDHGSELVDGSGQATGVWSITLLDNIMASDYDNSGFIEVLIGPGGVLAILDAGEGSENAGTHRRHSDLLGCLTDATTTSPGASAVLDAARRRPGRTTIEGDFVTRSLFSSIADDEPGQTARTRPGFQPDPADPEPIKSTGANKWDLIRTVDPSAFVCLNYLGQGPEEFLAVNKEGGYQQVADAFLYEAHFLYGPTIKIRLHSEFGTKAVADAEVERYLIPLGQLPLILRQDIQRFAVRIGDNTATASQGEGIMVQSANMTERQSDNRLEETLFHEAVHTSLDPVYAYQLSEEWLDAQEADGRWLTEYGRNNPDSEDLAESALYGYALFNSPQRYPAGMAEEISERIPNRLEILRQIFAADQGPQEANQNSPECRA